ncbi:MAG: exostosin family protein [Candidatus Pacebacteria bacterium]|nr:exostosin family protein [Candidatus Paceibacterota bacterium]
MNPEPQVRLYVGEHYREPKLFTHVELLFPFWGVTAKDSMPYVRSSVLQYQYQKKDFTLVEHISEADYVLLPYNYARLRAVNPKKLAMILEEAHRAGKPIIIDGAGDIERPITVPNSVILRVSQYRYSVQPNEITIPFSAEDLLETYVNSTLPERIKTDTPSIGFTGWADITPLTRAKLFVKELPIYWVSMFDRKRGAEHKGLIFRKRALASLAHTEGIIANITVRASYSGHVKTIQGSVQNNRSEFVKNLLESDYALVVKGDANSSVRFYEALSLGCVPVFIDTACVLPLEDTLTYREFCVFVDWQDVDRVGEKLREFHAAISPEQFKRMRELGRTAYRDFLRKDSFSQYLAANLRKRLSENKLSTS